jgi:hypothetical protein
MENDFHSIMIRVEQVALPERIQNLVGSVIDHIMSTDRRQAIALNIILVMKGSFEITFEERRHRFNMTRSVLVSKSSISGICPLELKIIPSFN